jgi:ATP-dependent Clp protease ATP-binding subunit ClpC
VWDLFLQVFDDGRLTDASGRTVDFRHTIIVLTSNLGSTIQQQAGPGFVDTSGGLSPNQVLRVVNQSFRPEFVNRLDAILVFRPLTRALMRGILLNELAKVLERRGLRDREWAVEWESSALDFLLEKGFSPAMGARPLKRAIDRYLLAPLAATLVEHRAPEGDQFLFVRSDGHGIQVEFVDPDAPSPGLVEADAPVEGRTLASMILHATGAADERGALVAECRELERRLSDNSWTSIEHALQCDMQDPTFWSRPDRFDVLSRYALIDRIRAATETARGLESRLDRSRKTDNRYSRDLVARLALQLLVIGRGVADVLERAPVEMVLSVQPTLDAAHDATTSDHWCAQLFEMYQRWAARRHMQWEPVPGPRGVPRLALVSGFGAARVLSREVGLHNLDYEVGREGLARVVARVRAVPTPPVMPDSPAARHAALVAELERQTTLLPVVRRYRLGASPLIRDVASGWRTGRPELVLGGDFDLLAGGVAQVT